MATVTDRSTPRETPTLSWLLRPARVVAAETGDMVMFGAQAVRYMPGSLRYFAELLRQTAFLIVGSSLFVIFLTFAIGGECVLWFVSWAQPLGGAPFAGFVNVPCGINELFPLCFAYAFAAKVATGLVAEIGAMRISNEIDAMDVSGIDSMRYVIGTRLIAVIVFVPLAYGISLITGMFGGWLTGVIQLGEVSPARYFQGYWTGQVLTDSLDSMVKALTMCFGAALVGLYYGYRAGGGPAGVGRAVARSMIVNLIWIQFMAFIWSAIFFGRGAHFPFGG